MSLLSTEKFVDYQNCRIDLHSHTNCSDGRLTPQELIERAVNYQLDVLAITDHDTTAGLSIAKKHILERNYAITLIDGVEISTSWHGFEIHIVGLNIDQDHPALMSLIAEQQTAREQRATLMGEKLAKCGFSDIYQQAKALAGAGSITRAHFATVLHQQGVVSSMQKAFDKYIGKDKRAYVKPLWCEIETAVSVIKQAGGVAVMAHPIRYDMTAKWLRRLIVQFKEAGGDGLEVVLPQMNNDQRQRMLNYCLEYDLYASLGSDFHYPSRWTDIGKNLVLPDNCQPIWQCWH